MSRIVRWLIAGALGGLVLAGTVLFTAAVANKDSSGGSTVILPQLKATYERASEQANLPVLLPTEFPERGTEFWLSEYIGSEGNQYTLSVDVESGCAGAGACSRGSIGGEIVTVNTEPVEKIYSFLNESLDDPNRPRSDDPMGDVELINGLEGFFVPWIATAQCSEAKIYWELPSIPSDERYRYYVGIECGDRADVVELANNVIANTEGL